MNTSLTLSLNQLARLIGSFAFPDPDGDDSIVHGPGGPRVRSLLGEIRRVTVAVAEWAERLGEQAMLSVGAQSDAPGTAPPKPRPIGDAASPSDSSSKDDGCDPQTDGTKGKGPPGTARVIIDPPIHAFVHDLESHAYVRLPVAAAHGPNPWQLGLGPESVRGLELLVAGAELQFASEASRLTGLTELFERAARRLIEEGLRRLGHGSHLQLSPAR